MKFKDVVDNLNILKLDKIADCLSDYIDKVNNEKIPFLFIKNLLSNDHFHQKNIFYYKI